MVKKPRVIREEVRYPWSDWFAIGSFKLLQGHHYNCKTDGFIIQMRNAAKARGKRVSVSVRKDFKGDSIQVSVREAPEGDSK